LSIQNALARLYTLGGASSGSVLPVAVNSISRGTKFYYSSPIWPGHLIENGIRVYPRPQAADDEGTRDYREAMIRARRYYFVSDADLRLSAAATSKSCSCAVALG
jgi:hypothetical protein